jgi:uncharacterized protein (UPF0276 family)
MDLGLAWTYDGGRPGLLQRILPLVDYLEVMPDALSRMRDGRAILDEARMAELEAVVAPVRIIVHGIGLSIGSHDGWSDRYIGLLDELVPRLNPAWHSEHLAYTSVDGEHLETMLTLPRIAEALDLVVARVDTIQQRYGIPFLLENVVRILPDHPAEYSEAAFINEIARRTGCGILLDAYNLECDAHNNAFSLDDFLEELDLDRVREIHLAGGVENRGYKLDVHSRRVADTTVALAERVLAMATGTWTVTYEVLEEAVQAIGEDAIVEELGRLRDRLVAAPVS